MARPSGTTSLQRTYRYLRLAIAGAVVVVFTAVLVAMPAVDLLPSLSHDYYTPANTMFVGALMAVSVCFFALSGRGAERVPLIAIVPTMISPRSVPGVDADCPRGEGSCVPQTFDAAVDAGIATYLVVGAVFVLVAAALAAAGQVDRPGTALSLAISGAVLLTVWLTWWLARDEFLRGAHLAAAAGFFAIIAAVALVQAFRPAERAAPRWLKAVYLGIAIALAVVVVGTPLYGSLHVGRVFGVFVGEVLALALFAAFWVLQSVQYWRVDDPAIRAEV